MTFSIITATFNRAHTLQRALDSVIAQDYDDWELIIVDDGSTDETSSLVNDYRMRDNRIHYLYQSNSGQASARNAGVKISTGRYITFLDSDDEYLASHLSSREKILSLNPSIELLHGGVEIIGDPFVADKDDPSKMIHLNDCVIGGTFFIRRDLWKRLGGYRDIPYADDSDFYERAIDHGALIMRVEFPTYRYDRTSSDSLCSIVMRSGMEGIVEYRNT
jgi:glycosyltransferase involved in cell wall biosynthesis